VDVVIDSGLTAAETVRLKDLLAVCGVELESFAWMEIVTPPDCVGTPLNCPELALIVIHPGSDEPDAVDHE